VEGDLESGMERDEALFVNLVLVFKSAAMQQMGKVADPLTGKVERNLEQARFSIDTIAMLKEKTRGNLSDDLAKLLDSVLLELRMNFVEEAKAAGGGPAREEAAGAGKAEGSGGGADDGEAGGGAGTRPDPAAEGRQDGRQGE